MLCEWQEVQKDVWQLDAEVRLLGQSAKDSLELLCKQRRHHGELSHALRHLRRVGQRSGSAASIDQRSPSNGSASGLVGFAWPRDGGNVWNLDDAVGQDVAKVWTSFLQSVTSCPRYIPTLARATGPQSYEVFAYLSCCCIEDPLAMGALPGSACAVVKALEDILETEFDALAPDGSSLQISALTGDDSFLSCFLQAVSHTTSCMAWAQAVLNDVVMEKVLQIVPPQLDGKSLSAAASTPTLGTRGVSNDALLTEGSRRSVTRGSLSTSSATNADVRKIQRLTSFLGEKTESVSELKVVQEGLAHLELVPPPLDAETGSVSARRRFSTTQTQCGAAIQRSAVEAVVTSLCEQAANTPMWICHLFSALNRQILRRCTPKVARSARVALLGGQFVSRWWLIPSLLQKFSHTSTFGLLVLVDTKVHGAVNNLAKALKAVFTLDLSAVAADSHDEFLACEAERLQAHFFDVLLIRSENNREEALSGVLWPRCFVCTTMDLEVLRQAGFEEMTSVESRNLLMKRFPPAPAPTVVVCWLHKGLVSTLPTPGTDTLGVPLARGVTRSFQLPQDLSDLPGDSGSTCGVMSLWNEAPTSSFIAKCSPRAPAPAAAETGASSGETHDAEEDPAQQGVMSLVWQVLSEPQLVDGPSASSLAAALRGLKLQLFGMTLSQQLQLEMLAEWLEPEGCPEQQGIVSDAWENPGTLKEQELLERFRRVLVARRYSVSCARRVLHQIRVAQRTVGQQCAETLDSLTFYSRLSTELRCSHYLQSIWQSRPNSARTPDDSKAAGDGTSSQGTLRMCVLSPHAKPRVQAGDGKARWGLFATHNNNNNNNRPGAAGDRPGQGSHVGAQYSKFMDGPMPPGGFIPNTVQVFDVQRCPCHRVASVGATMGLDLEQTVKHQTAQGFRHIVECFKKLSLESILEEDDPYNIVSAIQSFIEMVCVRVIMHCKNYDPPERARISSSGRSFSVAEEMAHDEQVDQEWPGLLSLARVDEKFVREYTGRLVFSLLHSKIFPSQETVEDVRISTRMANLHWLQPRHLDVPDALARTSQADRAVLMLAQLHQLRSPDEMLASLAAAFRNVTEAAFLRVRMGVVPGGGDGFGADAALPLFILVVIRAKPQRLSSVCLYMERFTTRAQMLTEQGYALTQVRAAISFAEAVRQRDLMNLQPGEWERHMEHQTR